MPRRFRPFDAFLAGALAFVAGVSFTLAMRTPGWSSRDATYVIFAIAGAVEAAWLLRGMFLVQAV